MSLFKYWGVKNTNEWIIRGKVYFPLKYSNKYEERELKELNRENRPTLGWLG
jgi:hypothetical protein